MSRLLIQENASLILDILKSKIVFSAILLSLMVKRLLFVGKATGMYFWKYYMKAFRISSQKEEDRLDD